MLLAALLLTAAGAEAGMSKDLVNAARGGDVNEVRDLLDKGANPNRRSGDIIVPPFSYVFGKTPLCAAAEAGHADVVKLLLDRGADRTIRCDGMLFTLVFDTAWARGYTPLLVAAYMGYADVVRVLLDEPRPQALHDILQKADVASDLNHHNNALAVFFLVVPMPGSFHPRSMNAAATAAYANHREILPLILSAAGKTFESLDADEQLEEAGVSDQKIREWNDWLAHTDGFAPLRAAASGFAAGFAAGAGAAVGAGAVQEMSSSSGSSGGGRAGAGGVANPACGCPAGFPVWRGGSCYQSIQAACQGVQGECGTYSCR